MSKTSLPGFTAEASLYNASAHYRMLETDSVGEFGQQVEPQMLPRELRCYFDCLDSVGSEEGWSDICAHACTHRRL